MNEINQINNLMAAIDGNGGGAVAGILSVIILAVLLFKGSPKDWGNK